MHPARSPESEVEQPLLLSVQAASNTLGLSPRHLRRLIAEGALRAISVGRARRLRRADVLAVVAAGLKRRARP